MADKSKKAKNGSGAKPAVKKAAGELDTVDDLKVDDLKKVAVEADEHAEVEGAPASAHDAGHAPAKVGAHQAHDDPDAHGPNYREYFMVFMVLFVLTVLEVAVTKVPGINRHLMAVALVTMAVTKAAFVGLYYMHLKHETKVLKLTVALPLAAPMIYAFVLISEAVWRLGR
jgi:cytochrome c oxidase subunit IV